MRSKYGVIAGMFSGRICGSLSERIKGDDERTSHPTVITP